MPVVTISIKQLSHLLKKEYPMETIVESLEQLGCDVEDTVEINLYSCPVCSGLNDKLSTEEGARRCTFCGHEQETDFEKYASDGVVRLDLLANRPDLFNVTGLSRALKGYLGLEEGMPEFKCKKSDILVKVDPSVLDIRPYIVCAVINLPPVDQTVLRELMKMQENLHWGVGRDRKLASIGIYDMSTLTLPITYKSVSPTNFKFHALGVPQREMTPQEILKEHPKGTAYAHLLETFDHYPLLMDSKGLTLSMPPIINSEETKVKVGSSRLFVDVTGIGEQAVTDALNILCCSVVELGGTVETVEIRFPDKTIITPDLSSQDIGVSLSGARRWIGVDFSQEEFIKSIQKMRMDVFPVENSTDGDKYNVRYPVYRSDIRHEVDVFEDILIGYGLNRIPMKLVPNLTVGQERPEERIGNMVRNIMTGLGFIEVMSLNLNSEENHFTRLQLEAGDSFVSVENPKTLNQKVLRSHLISGIMESFEKNRKKAVPQRIFEIGTVTQLDDETEIGIKEFRKLSFGIIGPEAGYAEGRAVLDSVLRELGKQGIYEAGHHPTFLDGRFAIVKVNEIMDGYLGEIHPQVLNNFFLDYPVVFCELTLARVY